MVRALPAAVFAIPVVALLLGALHEPDALIPTGWAFIPDAPTFASFERAFELVDLDRQLANSALVVVVAVPLSVVVASWAGFAMTLLEPRARRWAIGLTLVLLVVPASAVWAPRFVLFSRLGLTDSPAVLMIPALMGTTPFAVLLFHWSFRRIPRDLIDAARLAGLGPWAIWRRVAMPLARPTTAAVAAIVFAIHWGDFVERSALPLLAGRLHVAPRDPSSRAAAGDPGGRRAGRRRIRHDPGADRVRARAAAVPRRDEGGWMARSLIVLVVLALALVLAACGGDDDKSRPISFQVSGDPEEIAVYHDLIKRSGQEVRLIEVGDRKDHLTKLTTSFAARRPPDVFLINYRNLGGFASRGVIETVGDRVDVSGFYPITVQAFTVGGKLQCVAAERLVARRLSQPRPAARGWRAGAGRNLVVLGVPRRRAQAAARRPLRCRDRSQRDPRHRVRPQRGRAAGGRRPRASPSTRRPRAAVCGRCSTSGA